MDSNFRASASLTTRSLQESDRDKLKSAASTVSTYATIGSVVGLGLGVFLAYRLRANRTAMFQAFKTAEKPTEVRFANGRSGESKTCGPIGITQGTD